MGEQLKGLENKLNEALVKNAPFQLPEAAKKWIVKYGPYIGLVVGILGLMGVLSLWNFAHDANSFIDTANELSKAYGVSAIDNRLNLWFYIVLIISLIQAVIAIAAFSGLKARSKTKGWDLLFYSALLSIVYAVLSAIYNFSIGSLFGNILGSVIGLYILFQIRDMYHGAKAKKSDK